MGFSVNDASAGAAKRDDCQRADCVANPVIDREGLDAGRGDGQIPIEHLVDHHAQIVLGRPVVHSKENPASPLSNTR